MEKMPFQPEMTSSISRPTRTTLPTAPPPISPADATTSDWRQALPIIASAGITLRELRIEDAPTLFAMLSTEEATRFISPPPTSVEGFARFIEWAIAERKSGNYICFAVVPAGMTTAVGLFQVRALDPLFGVAEWGFAIGSEFWGTGIFAEGAREVMAFAFEVVGVHRLEARASVTNGRGNGALRKIGAVQEGVLRRSFLRHGQHHDQVMWSLLAEDWRARRVVERRPSVH
jgi:RimJ/RimL family protein N-acetyltransferase